jgi:hypothetical protein
MRKVLLGGGILFAIWFVIAVIIQPAWLPKFLRCPWIEQEWEEVQGEGEEAEVTPLQ